MTDINTFLKGGTKVPSANLKEVGNKVVGTITELDVTQARKFGTQDLDFWEDGKPKEQLVVTLQTDERDPTIEEDDGRRRIYALQPSELLRTIAAASVDKGTPLAVGGRLAVIHTGTKPHEKPGFNPIKLYDAAYDPPAQSAAADLMAGANSPTNGGAAAEPVPVGQSAAGLL